MQSLSEYSCSGALDTTVELVMSWQTLSKEGSFSIQQKARKADPFTRAKRIIKKKLNDLSSRQYAVLPIRSSGIILDLPMWPRRKAVAEFHLTTGYDCLLKHLYRIHIAQAPCTPCTLCDFRENMDADRIRR
ncbi:hypothetical protein TNCV_4352531 [Trichonephila clavipes]|nr:hypothetical protein TNCV_4352531 [Trichonephila clavipes]